MKQKAALFCLSLFMGTSLWAENAEKKGVESINRLTAEAHVEFLASDELQGREAGFTIRLMSIMPSVRKRDSDGRLSRIRL